MGFGGAGRAPRTLFPSHGGPAYPPPPTTPLLVPRRRLVIDCEERIAHSVARSVARIMTEVVPDALERVARAGPFGGAQRAGGGVSPAMAGAAGVAPAAAASVSGSTAPFGGFVTPVQREAAAALLGGSPRLCVPLAVSVKVGRSFGRLEPLSLV